MPSLFLETSPKICSRTMCHCPSKSIYCCDEISWNILNNLARKVFIWLILLHYHLSSKEIKTEIQTEQKPGVRSWCRVIGGVLITGLYFVACSACFLLESRTTRSEIAPPAMDWVHLNQPLTRKMFYRLVCSPVLWSIFLIGVPCFHMTLACIKLT